MPEEPQTTQYLPLLKEMIEQVHVLHQSVRRLEDVVRQLDTTMRSLMNHPAFWAQGKVVVYWVDPKVNPAFVAEEFIRKGFPTDPTEAVVSPWKHLVRRPHPWRRQLYIKGRNMTVRQLLATVKPNRLTLEEAAEALDLPVQAIDEALQYAEENPDVLESDAAWERHLLAQKGQSLGSEPVPG